eukprot:scaffold90423_cov36-Cyclotella_meneghiniana.AAC.1
MMGNVCFCFTSVVRSSFILASASASFLQLPLAEKYNFLNFRKIFQKKQVKINKEPQANPTGPKTTNRERIEFSSSTQQLIPERSAWNSEEADYLP